MILDAISPLEKAKLSGQLVKTISELQSQSSPLKRIPLAKLAAELILKITGAASDSSAPIDSGQQAPQPEDDLSDDPNSPNYRFKDTGYIGGSRKEQAESQFRNARQTGSMLRATDIDWEEIEKNPRQAKQLITKSNLFGKVDWQGLQAAGVDPNAAFLIDRVYASIAKEPEGDDNAKRRIAYAKGIETIRARLEVCKTVEQVLEVLAEIKSELLGVNLNSDEAEKYAAMVLRIDELSLEYRKHTKAAQAQKDLLSAAGNDFYGINREVEKRKQRGWKPDPELDEKLRIATEARDKAALAYEKYKAENPLGFDDSIKKEIKVDGGYRFEYEHTNPLIGEISTIRKQMTEMIDAAKVRNVTSDTNLPWLTFGDRFFKLLHWRNYKGSDAFQNHVVNAKNGRIPDWSWVEKEKTEVKAPTKREVTFALKVSTTHDRRGGKDISAASTKELENLVGFRAVQSGKYVLDDPASARFHVQQTAAAMSDLSDMVGIDINALGLGGRLGMAFGARGRGNAGFGGAAAAHYEPVQRVINMTKHAGGGSLAHEWVHSVDNMLPELMGIKDVGADSFVTENTGSLPDGAIKSALLELNAAMSTGDKKLRQGFKVTDQDRRTAAYNFDNPRNAISREIKAAGNASDAMDVVDRYYAKYAGNKRLEKQQKQYRTLVAAYYGPKDEDQFYLKTGVPVSSFRYEAQILDGGKTKEYWGSTKEMFARAFQSYIEDKLAANDRLNDYLSSFADNKYHVDPLLGIEWKPYPEGEERTRINAAFEKFFKAISSEKIFENATKNKALLDSIFGEQE